MLQYTLLKYFNATPLRRSGPFKVGNTIVLGGWWGHLGPMAPGSIRLSGSLHNAEYILSNQYRGETL
jgi:hypothetical protein